MAILSRDQILSAPDIQTETVPVPEWGGEVLVRGMTGEERDKFEASIVDQTGKKIKVNTANLRAKLVALAIVGEDGRRLFTDADVRALGAKSAAALQRVFEVAQRLSMITENDMEELVKNSEGGRNAASTSA